jgi:hypothetical protein
VPFILHPAQLEVQMNSKKRRCRHCSCLFKVCNKVKKHEYCSKKACQLTRKRNWQKEKLNSDQTYREDQQSAQQDWQANNPDYWEQYRQKNKRYTATNRRKQCDRNARRRKKVGNLPPQKPIAKMDAIIRQNDTISGRYKLVPLGSQLIAKMDAIIVEISAIS